MTEIQSLKSLVELEETTDEGKQEMSAARAEVRTGFLLRKALRVTGTSQKALAERLGVSEGRVSQVLNSSDGLKVSTVARYLRAMGYELELDASPEDPSVPPLKTTRKQRHRVRVYAFGHQSSASFPHSTVILTDRENLEPLDVNRMIPLGEIDSASANLKVNTFRAPLNPEFATSNKNSGFAFGVTTS